MPELLFILINDYDPNPGKRFRKKLHQRNSGIGSQTRNKQGKFEFRAKTDVFIDGQEATVTLT